MKDYKRAYSTNEGDYSGFKMTLAIEERSCKPLTILISPASPHDTKIFDDILFKLKKTKNIEKNTN
jgi:hypothetical protein